MKLRIATFNLENLDITTSEPTLEQRKKILTPIIERMQADIICFQEVHGQETSNDKRELIALLELLRGTTYENYHLSTTKTENPDKVYDKRNLVTISKFPILESNQFKNDFIPAPFYKSVTEIPEPTQAGKIGLERPFLYSKIGINGAPIHIVNVHLKSRIPIPIKGQSRNFRYYTKWNSAAAWAEGSFISSMKRVSQALEVRMFIDNLFDQDENAKVIVCGDFNAHPDEVPVQAICGSVENHGNTALKNREMLPCENTIPDSSRYTYLHHGKKRLLDHLLMSRNLLQYYRTSEIHNEVLPDESLAGASDQKFPESDHAPFISEFDF